MVELVGPSSTLSDKALSTFEEWEGSSCPSSHELTHSLEWYQSAYDAIEKTAVQQAWEASSGLSTPRGIMVSMPTSTLDVVSNTISLSATITQTTVTESSHTHADGSVCLRASMDVDDFVVQYVQNDALLAEDASPLSLADWESDIETAHAQFISTAATTSSWDRYLDTHIGWLVGWLATLLYY